MSPWSKPNAAQIEAFDPLEKSLYSAINQIRQNSQRLIDQAKAFQREAAEIQRDFQTYQKNHQTSALQSKFAKEEASRLYTPRAPFLCNPLPQTRVKESAEAFERAREKARRFATYGKCGEIENDSPGSRPGENPSNPEGAQEYRDSEARKAEAQNPNRGTNPPLVRTRKSTYR